LPAGVARVGDARRLNPEALVALQPDLVVAWMVTALQPLEHIMQTLHTAVFYSQPKRLYDIPAQLESVGRLMGTSARAQAAADALRRRLRHLEVTYQRRQPPLRVFVQVGQDPLYTLNGQHIVSDALRICGAVNIFAHLPVPAPIVGVEAVLHEQPDVIVAAQTSTGFPDAHAYWSRFASALPAARAENI